MSISFAVRVNGRLFGQISLAYEAAPALTPHQVALVEALSTQAALAIELARLADKSVQSETARAIVTERNRMAGEIHDSLAQAFTSIALQAEAMLSEMDDRSPLRESLSVVEETARVGLAEARSSVLALRPVGDKPGDLELALESLANRCTIAGTLACSFRSGATSCRLSADARDAALRVAQEAVANALRHAKAKRVDIHYEAVDGWMTLSIRDDGVGIPTHDARTGVGLSGMRARAAALGGTLTVGVAPEGRGTEVRLSIPAEALG